MGYLVYFLVFYSALFEVFSQNFAYRSPFTGLMSAQESIYDVMQFGAVGNGIKDDSEAFQSAWEAACSKASDSAIVNVPVGKTFLVSPITFRGPCKTRSIIFQIVGTIVAPPQSAWKHNNKITWIYFHGVSGLSVIGNGQGQIDGRGDSWWGKANVHSRPTAMRFGDCDNLQVIGLKSINSQRNHISLDHCNQATLSNLHMIAPTKSPNTDGIDIDYATNLHIQDSTIQTGDDCIAMRGITSNVIISNIACGPGHGISIGSLGGERCDEVENIHVTNCSLKGTKNGVRIKTLPGGSGFARNISFSGINFIGANNPVIIDQFYCPHKTCQHGESNIKISDVRYTGLRGTSIAKKATVNFRCSHIVPCTNIIVEGIDIKPVNPTSSSSSSQCINAHGIARDCTSPPVNCLNN